MNLPMYHKTLLSLLLSCSLLTACVQTPALAPSERPKHWGTLLNQQHNLYQISPDVFRSEQPSHELASEIQKYGIDVVINLRTRDDDAKTLSNTNLKLVHIPIQTWAINREDLLNVMQQIQLAKQNKQKVLIHCYHGSDRTGASIAMYRIIFEDWDRQDAIHEMKHGGYGFHVVWKNIEALFTAENIKWIREQLPNPS